MKIQIKELAKQYLEDVNTILQLLKSRVGEAKNGMGWQANIPREGSFQDLGITYFKRHGAGILVEYNGKIIDFDFSDTNIMDFYKSDKIITIDIGFLRYYIESIKPIKIEYNDIKDRLNHLVESDILFKIDFKYYFKEDLPSEKQILPKS